jgi:tetratricopeptide (TPR) repeat protein
MSQFSSTFSDAFSQAIATYNAGKLVESEQYCQEVIAGQPDFIDALRLLAVVQLKLRKYETALASFDRIIALRPGYALAHYHRGNALQFLRRFEEALASYDRAIALRPNFALAHVAHGHILRQLARYDEALASYNRAIALRPDFADVYSDRGNALKELNRYTEALASYDRAIALRPNLAIIHYNRGNVLQDLLRFEEALASYERAIALRPDFPEAFSNRANVLQRLKRFVEAVASYDRALTLRPDFSDAFSNRGAALQELRRHDEAVASYSQAWKIRPDYADAQYNEALCRLVVGDFARGWELHESRWQTAQLRNDKRNFTQPLWLGSENISDKIILLRSEQGFGDTIQFCRYVPLVAARGARVILDVQVPLTGLMGSLAGTTQVLSTGFALPYFDTHCPLLSLPLAFGTRLETIPSAVPYLHASPDQIRAWDSRLGPKVDLGLGLLGLADRPIKMIIIGQYH